MFFLETIICFFLKVDLVKLLSAPIASGLFLLPTIAQPALLNSIIDLYSPMVFPLNDYFWLGVIYNRALVRPSTSEATDYRPPYLINRTIFGNLDLKNNRQVEFPKGNWRSEERIDKLSILLVEGLLNKLRLDKGWSYRRWKFVIFE